MTKLSKHIDTLKEQKDTHRLVHPSSSSPALLALLNSFDILGLPGLPGLPVFVKFLLILCDSIISSCIPPFLLFMSLPSS